MAARRRPVADAGAPPSSDDPLALYNQKRRFSVTPEPPGDLAPTRAAERSFVIQKHAAGRLHYDFRLELDGVLKSWSVPKGPSLDPAQKRLAVETENHPLAYGGFEGIIPEGEYGGGTVLVWDNGTWEPVEEGPGQTLASGHLKFFLRGKKLRGKFALVRLKGREPADRDGRNWLLVKDRDAFARPELAGIITDEEPFSVMSGRDLEEIAEAKDRVWHSVRGRLDVAKLEGAREADMPEGAPPFTRERHVRGSRRSRVPPGDDWLHERLLQGQQLHICLDNGHVRFFPRGDKRRAHVPRRENPGLASWWVSPLALALAGLPVREGWWEGVVTSLDTEGGTSDVPKKAPPPDKKIAVCLFITDIAHLDGTDTAAVPYELRRRAVTELLALAPEDVQRRLRVIDHVIGRGADVAEAAHKLGFAGLVSKRRDYSRGQAKAIVVTWG